MGFKPEPLYYEKSMKNRKLKVFAVVLIIVGLFLFTSFELTNRNSINMTARQKLLRTVYPLIMGLGKLFKSNSKVIANRQGIKPVIPFYSLKTIINNGGELDFGGFRGKKVLLVNTASDCGFTGQYDDLQKLYGKFKNQLVVIGFPANDFK